MGVKNEVMTMLDERDLLAIKKLFDPVHERLDRMDERFDKVDERLDKVEEHNRKTDEHFDRLELRVDEISKNIGLLMDQEFAPRFNLLAENQQLILDRMVPVSRVEALEDEVKFLKVVIRQMNEDIQELKKAT